MRVPGKKGLLVFFATKEGLGLRDSILYEKMFVSNEKHLSMDWSEYTVILPAVSIGNVGQLAVDLVVSSISPNCSGHIGYFCDSCILPVVGNDAFTQSATSLGKLNVSVEVYKNDDLKIVAVQQRAPLIKGCQTEYCRKLITWVKSCNFKQVILVSSISATERVDSQIEGSPLRYLVTPSAKNLTVLFDELSWKVLEKRPKFPHVTEESSADTDFFFPGGGITKKLFEACCREDIPLAVLLTFCSEGDNMSDAVNLFLYLNDWLKVVPRREVEDRISGKASSFVIPASWRLMFGSPIHPQGNLF